MPKVLIFIASIFIFFSSLIPETHAVISFSISNPQSDNDETTFDVSLSGLASSSCSDGFCYLQAAFTGQSQPRYFGFTKNNTGEWYKYSSSLDKNYIKSTFFSFQPQEGNWSGKLTIKVDSEDPDYKGPGSYNIKAWRYSGNSNGASGASDNTLTIELTTSASPTPTPSPSPTPASSAQTSSPKSPSPTPKVSPTPAKSPSANPQISAEILGQKAEASEQAAATSPKLESPTPTPQAQSSNRTKIASYLVGSGLIVIGLSMGAFLWYHRTLKKKDTDEA